MYRVRVNMSLQFAFVLRLSINDESIIRKEKRLQIKHQR